MRSHTYKTSPYIWDRDGCKCIKMTHVIQMSSTTGEGMKLKQFEGIVFCNVDGIDPELGLKFIQAFQYQEGDIVQCSYPKSGFHWFGNMIWKLKSLEPTDRPRDDVIEYANQERYDMQQPPRIICSHVYPSRLCLANIETKGKMVFVLRNPKDVLVSMYHHVAVLGYKQSFNEFFQSFIIGEVPYGSYFKYLSDCENVLKDIIDGKSNLRVDVFYYENFVHNPNESLARLNAYLGFNRDEEYLECVLKDTTLNTLRERYLSPELKHPLSVDADGNSVIFRKGKVGDWKQHLTVAQSETIDTIVAQALQHGLIKFKYEP